MVNHSNKNNKDTQNLHQTPNDVQLAVLVASESGHSSGSGMIGDGVQAELSRMNANMERMLGCFYRMMHDRGKELDRSFNGGFCELGDIGHRDHRVEIEKLNGVIGSEVGRIESSFDRMANQIRCSAPIITSDQTRPIYLSFKGGFDSRFEGSSMESEASHHPYMVNQNLNGDSEASRQHTNSKSDNLEAKIQALRNLVNRSPIRDEDPIIAGFHGAIGKSKVQLSDFEANGMKINIEHANFGEYMVVADVVVEAEVILVDQELENASKGMKCGEVGAGDSFVDSNRNGDVAGDKHTHEVFCANESATGKMGIQILGAESYNGGFIPNIEVLEVQLIHEEFEDPFYDSSNLVQNSKFQLMLAVGMDKSRVEVRCLLVVDCEMCLVVMKFQAVCAADRGVQWLRKGVG